MYFILISSIILKYSTQTTLFNSTVLNSDFVEKREKIANVSMASFQGKRLIKIAHPLRTTSKEARVHNITH